ncbi:MAG: oxidoreductase [Deltaproteobacteria bacterium]|nr:oxidoreductase [Deltaproteobacteria bacterium]
MREAKLIAARMLTPEVRELTVDAGPGFVFEPGQWVSFRIPQSTEDRVARAYSIASPPRQDGTFLVAVTRVEGGPGSNFLHTIEPGEPLAMLGPEGLFTLHKPERPILMVATGTGVSPFRSILLAYEQLPETLLLFGHRTEQDLLYREDFVAIEQRRGSFRYIPTLSRGGPEWPGRRGYVQSHVPEMVRMLGGDCDVYVCGLNKMIQQVRGVLKNDLGIPRQRIHSERYD